jgi:hypothetical protein
MMFDDETEESLDDFEFEEYEVYDSIQCICDEIPCLDALCKCKYCHQR